MFVQLLHY